MGLRLRLMAAWLPETVLCHALDRVAEATGGALDALLAQHAPGWTAPATRRAGSPEERRAAMAAGHEARVAALVDAVGRERAAALGREALFAAGVRLGQEARRLLGVRASAGDLEPAARVLYGVLGIEFTVAWQEEESAVLRVTRCALARHYSATTCLLLCAADEGVVQGLCPGARMEFTERMTAGAAHCLARISLATGGRR